MVEYGVKLTCDKCLTTHEAWVESTVGATTKCRRRRNRGLWQELLQKCVGWWVTRAPDGGRVHLCETCRRDLDLLGEEALPPAVADYLERTP